MEIKLFLPKDLDRGLALLAHRTGRPRVALVLDAVRTYVEDRVDGDEVIGAEGVSVTVCGEGCANPRRP